MVGRTPWSAADAPVGLLALCMMLISFARQRDGGVPRGPGGPPRGPPHHLRSQRGRPVFHEISRAEGPPSRKPYRHIRKCILTSELTYANLSRCLPRTGGLVRSPAANMRCRSMRSEEHTSEL